MRTQAMEVLDMLTTRATLRSPRKALASSSGIPNKPGIYAWYFRETPELLSTSDCYKREGSTLLYVGIAPSRLGSLQSLQSRISCHLKGTAKSSTLRLSLGVLLTKESGFPLRRVGNGRMKTFTKLGEQNLTSWIDRNALVCWMEQPEPWRVEKDVFELLSLPLNIQHNGHHPFAKCLKKLRAEARANATKEPIYQDREVDFCETLPPSR
jgi:hypothetical protein